MFSFFCLLWCDTWLTYIFSSFVYILRHDFIAAGLSQCQVDERNLRLAFERLDQEHKGYITFDNVMDLLGDEAFDTEDDMLNCWAESMKDVDCKTALITYEDFVLLMKGQNRDKSSLRKSLTV